MAKLTVGSSAGKVEIDATKVLSNLNKLKVQAWSPPQLAFLMYSSAMYTLVPAVQSVIREKGIVFRGDLHQRTTARIALSAMSEIAVDVGPLGVPYAEQIEKGSPPFKPNFQKLKDWVRLKLGKTAVDLVAMRIARKIMAEGTEPHPFLSEGIAAGLPLFETDFQDRFRRHTNRSVT